MYHSTECRSGPLLRIHPANQGIGILHVVSIPHAVEIGRFIGARGALAVSTVRIQASHDGI